MKKFLFFIPLFLFSFEYPLEYKFQFMHSCMQNSSLPNKYQYCNCMFNKIKETFPYIYFANHSADKDVLNSLVFFSRECLQKTR